MELLKTNHKTTHNLIPIIGVESTPISKGDDLCYQIALHAYYKAEARGYEPGHETQDWLDAEAEVIAENERRSAK